MARREKRQKWKERIFFFFGKREKIKNIFDFFVAIFRNFGLNEKAKILALYFLFAFLQALFFVFETNWNIFFIVHALPKTLINVGHDFQKVPMTMKISHGGVCIFVMGVILSCDPVAYVWPSLLSSPRLHGVNFGWIRVLNLAAEMLSWLLNLDRKMASFQISANGLRT